MKAIYIIISVFFLVSCRQKNEHIKLTMESMMSCRVNLCLDELHDQTLIPHKDKDLERANLKIIQYVDSFECAPCILDYLHIWNSLINDRRLEKPKVQFAFIIAPSKEKLEDAYLSVQSSGVKAMIYIDSLSVFSRKNPEIPREKMYHTFVLDRNNNVVLIGNPILNKGVKELLFRLILN